MASIVQPVDPTIPDISVYLRCRPLKVDEQNVINVSLNRKEVRINDSQNGRHNSKIFTFDNAFASDSTQQEIYISVVEPLIEQVVRGNNCTLFAFGQTGTGKSYTMEGQRCVGHSFCSWKDDSSSAGITPRALQHLFERLMAENMEHEVKMSYLEAYDDELHDLLSPIKTKLTIFEDNVRKGSVIVVGLKQITVRSKTEIYQILKKESAKPKTLVNTFSSISHTIFSVTVYIKESEDLIKIVKLNFVDLGKGTKEEKDQETINLNQSLLVLTRVITALGTVDSHVPYRASKLTRFLQGSLDRHSTTSMIATISPNIVDVSATLYTLEFSELVKKMKTQPKMVRKVSKLTLVTEYDSRINRLSYVNLGACSHQANDNHIQQIADPKQALEEANALEIKGLKEELAIIKSLFFKSKPLELLPGSEQFSPVRSNYDSPITDSEKTKDMSVPLYSTPLHSTPKNVKSEVASKSDHSPRNKSSANKLGHSSKVINKKNY